MAAQARFVRCPSCQWGTLADGYFCAYCGRPLRPGGPGGGAQAAPPQQQPQQQPTMGGGPGASGNYQQPGQSPNYYNPGERGGSMSYYQGQGQAQGGGSARGPIRCPSCGAFNDPWLTHCKQCQRPLMTSG